MFPQTILNNGNIYTGNPRQPFVTAMAVHDGTIVALGNEDDICAMYSFDTTAIDLRGKCVVPGLIDAHVHFRNFALSLQRLDLFEVPTLDEALQRVAVAAAQIAPDTWLQGRGWTQELWDGHHFPTAAHLDRVAAHVPVYLTHKSGHAGWANSRALQLAGIDASTPDPPGGAIGRNTAGQPNGILLESAMKLLAAHIPPPTVAEIADAMRLAQRKCWEVGLVGLHDFDGRDSFQALQTLHQNGELGLRIVKNIPAARVEHAVEAGLLSGFGDPWLSIGGIKIFADGALGPRTALMVEPYEGEPDNRGIAVTDKEEMMHIARLAYQNGLSLTIHAIGDRAVHDVLDVYEVVQGEDVAIRPKTRNRIEHVQIIHPDDRLRLAQLNVIASMQPSHATSDMEMADRYWGKRAQYSYAARTMLESGATVVFGSDCPIESIDPMLGIYAAVTRRRPDGAPGPDGWYPAQRFSLPETIHAFTTAAAVTSGQLKRTGTIAVGKQADLTIFDRNIFAIPSQNLIDVKVAGTIVNGKLRYSNGDL
ncbi:MAG: amidohydrolase [Anaerolineae bacterium]|nr:amidohydrolase [Anaerolineae bacterium]